MPSNGQFRGANGLFDGCVFGESTDFVLGGASVGTHASCASAHPLIANIIIGCLL